MKRRTPASTLAWALGVFACLAASVAVVALVDQIGRSETESWAAAPFPSLPRTPAEVASIAVNNGRIIGSIVGAAVAVNAPFLARRVGQRDDTSRAVTAVRLICDLVLLSLVLRNIVPLGTGLSVYGLRMVQATAPHGVLEIAALSCVLALYLSARRGRVDKPIWIVLIGAAFALVATAAVIEVYVVL